jgi:hypothetical protein
VDLRAALLEPAEQVEEVRKGQVGMQSADDVELGGPFADALLGALVDFFERKSVGAGRVRAAPRRRWRG